MGTGLGLSVVRGIVKGHRGVIELESQTGQGTAFRVYLPVTDRAQPGGAVAAAPLPRGGERILLVDDEPALAEVLQEMLSRLGYEVTACRNGLEALELFNRVAGSRPFDLVITDMTMPQLTGASLARELLRIQPGLPVLLCTGFSEAIDPERIESLGIRGMLMKPVVLKDLAEAVRRALDGKAVPERERPTGGRDEVIKPFNGIAPRIDPSAL